MNTKGNTVLITGGGTGIGLEIAREFHKLGNKVIICGRREEVLLEVQKELTDIEAWVCDISLRKDRFELHKWVTSEFKDLNVLINNAGIQRIIDFTKGIETLEKTDNEIAINLEAPVHLSAMFFAHLSNQKESAIVNVTSGLGFVPFNLMPIYCATKAAMHSFTKSLRHQYRNSSVKVFELVPPIVDTDLDKGTRKARGVTDFGIKPARVAEVFIDSFAKDDYEIFVDKAKFLYDISRNTPDGGFGMMNK